MKSVRPDPGHASKSELLAAPASCSNCAAAAADDDDAKRMYV